MNQEQKQHFILFLIDAPRHQLMSILKILTKEQLQAIIEIIYNVVQGVSPISESNKSILNKNKNLIRRLVAKRSTLSQRKKIVLKLRNILPIFFRAYINYVS